MISIAVINCCYENVALINKVHFISKKVQNFNRRALFSDKFSVWSSKSHEVQYSQGFSFAGMDFYR